MQPALELKGLTKEYSGFKAVDGIDLKVEKGEMFGLLGPNGAGKTTTISMLVTMRRPSGGVALVNGFDVAKDPNSVRKSIGIVFQDQSLDEELTARENLSIHAAMYGVPLKERGSRMKELIQIVGLEDRLDDRVKNFSGGMKRRLEIARGLLHHPEILFLDEPTVGLDSQTRANIWGYVKKLNKEKKITIVLTTHYMDEADKVCDRVAIIDHGKVVVIGTPKKLKNSLGGDVISIQCDDGESCEKELNKTKWIKTVIKHDGEINIHVEKGAEKIPRLVELIEKKGMRVNSISMKEPSLDHVFLHYTGRTIREQEADPRERMRMRRKVMRR
jgi:ABC-2 type transport system ATP-binding protein